MPKSFVHTREYSKNARREFESFLYFIEVKYSLNQSENLVRHLTFQGTRDETSFIAALEGLRFHQALGGVSAITAYVVPLLDWAVGMMCEALDVKPFSLPASMTAPHLRALGESKTSHYHFDAKYTCSGDFVYARRMSKVDFCQMERQPESGRG